jgi:hypothetical protein
VFVGLNSVDTFQLLLVGFNTSVIGVSGPRNHASPGD